MALSPDTCRLEDGQTRLAQLPRPHARAGRHGQHQADVDRSCGMHRDSAGDPAVAGPPHCAAKGSLYSFADAHAAACIIFGMAEICTSKFCGGRVKTALRSRMA